MTISNGASMKKLILYPPTKPVVENSLWVEDPYEDEEIAQPLLTIEQSRGLKEQTKDNLLNQFLSTTDCIQYPESFSTYDHVFSNDFQENCDLTNSSSLLILTIKESLDPYSIPVEISPGKFLNINSKLDQNQWEQLIHVLQEQSGAFAWDYKDMRGIHPDTCIHHIYTQENAKPIRQPQCCMNPTLKDIVKEELQKLLNANFIYPISDSKWVSPLVIVPKKMVNGGSVLIYES
jgi:hypothetical protein